MENRAYALAAGLFTLIMGAGVIAAALWFSGETADSSSYLLVSRHGVAGLNSQAPVRYRGVVVGKVVDIEFDPLEPRAILVEITVKTGTPLTRGTYAQLGSQGVTGLSYVILDDDGSKPEPLAAPEDGRLARIEMRPSFIDDVTASGQRMIDTFSETARRATALMSAENQQQLVATLRNIDQATGKFVALAAALEPAAKSLEPSVKAFEPAAAALPALVGDARAALGRADAFLTRLNERVDTFERAAQGAARLGDRGAEVAESALIESLPRFNMLLDDLQRSARGLERLLQEINEQPQSIVFGRSAAPPGPGEPGFAAQRVAK